MKTKVHHQLLILEIAEELKREISDGYELFIRETKVFITRRLRRRKSVRQIILTTDRAQSLAIVAAMMK